MKKINFFTRSFEFVKTIVVEEDIFVEDIVVDAKITISTPFAEDNQIGENNIAIVMDASIVTYIGRVTSTLLDERNGMLAIEIMHISDVFNLECETISHLNGDIYTWITSAINSNIVTNEDPLLEMSIEFVNGLQNSYAGVLQFKTNNLKQCIKSIFDLNGTYLEYSIKYENSKPTALIVTIKNNNDSDPIKFKYTNPTISNLSRVYTYKQSINKLILIPDESVVSGQNVIFYLQSDGTITQDKNSAIRMQPVNQAIKYYNSSNTADDLVNAAKETLLGQQYSHNIQFTAVQNSSYDFQLYRRVVFYDKTYTYNSIVTKVIRSGDIRKITLGVVRSKLTEKLSAAMSKSGSSITNNEAILEKTYVDRFTDQSVKGIKSFEDGIKALGLGFEVADNTNIGIELGRRDGVAGTPYIDFHTDGTTADYNVRLLATGSKLTLNGNEIVSQVSISKADSGYLKLANGIILQWGTTTPNNTQTDRTVSFPTAYSSKAYVLMAQRGSGASATQYYNSHKIVSVSTASFVWQNGQSENPTYTWFAIGY